MRRAIQALLLAVNLLALLPARPSEAAAPSDRQRVYDEAGMVPIEQERIEKALDRWAALAGRGEGSAEALRCFEELGAASGLAACAGMAEGDGDRLGRGLLLLLEGCRLAASADFAGAAGALSLAVEGLAGSLDPGDVVLAAATSSLGVCLGASGDLEGALARTQEAVRIASPALGPEHEYVAMLQVNLAWFAWQLDRADLLLQACEEAIPHASQPWFDGEPGLLCLNHAGYARFQAADLAGAERLWRRALDLSVSLLGEESPQVTVLIGDLGNIASQRGRFAEARDLFRRAQERTERAVPEGDRERGRYLTWLAEAHAGLGELDEAAALHEAGLRIWERNDGPRSTTVAMALLPLATIRLKQGRYEEADALLRRAADIAMRAGERSVELAAVLRGQAEARREEGRHAEALDLYDRALSILEESRGPDHVDVAAALLNRANLLRELGDLARTKVDYERALAICERSVGPDHVFVATILANLAGLRLDLGDLDGALPLLERSVAIYERTVGPDHEWVGTGLNNLALARRELGDLEAAWALMQRAVSIWETTLGPDHPNTVTGRTNLAFLLASAGHMAEARDVYEGEVRAAQARLGPDHPLVATVRANLASVLRQMGELGAARKEYERALAIRRRSLGPGHPHLADLLVEIARLRRDEGDLPGARQEMAQAFALVQGSVVPMLDVTSERERIALVRSLRRHLDLYLSLFDRPEDAADAYRAVLAWKAVVGNSLAVQRDALLASREHELAGRLLELAEVRRQLATLVFAEPVPGGAAGQERRIVELTTSKEALERELARRSGAFEQRLRLDGTTAAEVCGHLPTGEALVDLLRYERTPADPTAEPVESYLAIVLLGGQCATPLRVELGAAEPIDTAVARYRRKLPQLEFGGRLAQQGADLRRTLWDPIEPLLGGRETIWLVPDGSLSGLPFAAMVGEDGRYLVERYRFACLASASELLRDDPEPARGALVVGGVDYDRVDAAGEARATRDGAEPGPVAVSRGAPRGALEDFAFLPATEAEAVDVAGRLARLAGSAASVLRLSGADASEGRIRAEAPGRRTIHLATHGFFATGAVRSALEGGSGPPSGGVVQPDSGGPVSGAAPEAKGVASGIGLNPMLLSGVVLAGANAPASAGEDDGVLTAEEVVGLDLRGTLLVTLSACETGLGEVADGEGVMGLRRAFALAGARSLVFSLWQVPDEETSRLMAAFYERLAGPAGDSPSLALWQAQVQLVTELRAERGEAPPLLWAAFVASGR